MSRDLRTEMIQELNDAWLSIPTNLDGKIIKPLDILKSDDPDTFHKKLAWLCLQPEYFSFMCKNILNIDLLPMQAMMLKELWNRRFPMLIGSRGLGKAGKLDEKIRTQNGWTTLGDVKVGDKVYGSDGNLTNVTYKTEPMFGLEFYKVTLRDGRSVEVCEDHLWKVWDKNKNRKTQNNYSVVSTKDMFENYYWDRKDSKSKVPKTTREFRYALPLNQTLKSELEQELPIHPYVLGVLLGDGGMTHKTITITSKDLEVVERVKNLLPEEYDLSKIKSSDYSYCIVIKEGYKKIALPFYTHLDKLGLWQHKSEEKFIPEIYKLGSHNQRLDIVKGLMDTDGCSSNNMVEFYTSSEKLSTDFLDVARSLGLHCKHSIKPSFIGKKQYLDCNRIRIYTNQPIFTLERKLGYVNHVKSRQGQSKYEKVFITNIEYVGKKTGCCITVDNDDSTYLIGDYIPTHNTFLLSLYALMRGILKPGRKIVVVGAAFRQSKFLHEYMENIWKNAPILRDMMPAGSGPRKDVDMCRMLMGDSVITALPIGDGSKIRGQRANDIVADEFASHAKEIFENVIAGFAAVSSSPVENAKMKAAKEAGKKMGLSPEQVMELLGYSASLMQDDNQIVLSGTAYYDFNHFAEYWRKWRKIIESKGEERALREIFKLEEGEELPESFNWKDYSVIRIPYTLLPSGFMDDAQIARSKATVHSGIYLMEFGACFAKDSKGFFKRSLIEECTGTETKPVQLASESVYYDPMLKGHPERKYILGVDPASEQDNFSIVVLEANPDHSRVVNVWTTTRREHRELLRKGIVGQNDFYSYCARKIRELMGAFNVIHIAMDAQGGGIAVSEALRNKNNLKEGEVCILPTIDKDKKKDTDNEAGLHILELCQFANFEWLSGANHGMRLDLEDKALLFPRFDPVTIGLSIEDDKMNKRLHDTLEDCVLEIEELKKELSIIEIRQTPSGKDQWDTPEIKIGVGKKGRLRKDRYSALLMANMAARQLRLNPEVVRILVMGGFAGDVGGKLDTEGAEFQGPAWFANQMNDAYNAYGV